MYYVSTICVLLPKEHPTLFHRNIIIMIYPHPIYHFVAKESLIVIRYSTKPLTNLIVNFTDFQFFLKAKGTNY